MKNLVLCPPNHRCLFQQYTAMMTKTSLKRDGEEKPERLSRTRKTQPAIETNLPKSQSWNTELHQVRKVQTVNKVQQIPHYPSTWAFQYNAICAAGRFLAKTSFGIVPQTTTLRNPTLDSLFLPLFLFILLFPSMKTFWTNKVRAVKYMATLKTPTKEPQHGLQSTQGTNQWRWNSARKENKAEGGIKLTILFPSPQFKVRHSNTLPDLKNRKQQTKTSNQRRG